jgi:hypothetical protein
MIIYVFGDSYSVEFNDNGLGPIGQFYCDWKGYIPKKYFHHLDEYFQPEKMINYAMSGNDNDNIFEKFTEIYKEIKHDDLIIFNWSVIERFSVDANIDYVVKDYKSHWQSSISHYNVDWVREMINNRSGSLYYNRIFKLIDFINETLKSNKVIHWSWNSIHHTIDNRTIKFETNGIINDGHYNEATHYNLYEKMISKLEKKDKVFINLWKKRLI